MTDRLDEAAMFVIEHTGRPGLQVWLDILSTRGTAAEVLVQPVGIAHRLRWPSSEVRNVVRQLTRAQVVECVNPSKGGEWRRYRVLVDHIAGVPESVARYHRRAA